MSIHCARLNAGGGTRTPTTVSRQPIPDRLRIPNSATPACSAQRKQESRAETLSYALGRSAFWSRTRLLNSLLFKLFQISRPFSQSPDSRGQPFKDVAFHAQHRADSCTLKFTPNRGSVFGHSFNDVLCGHRATNFPKHINSVLRCSFFRELGPRIFLRNALRNRLLGTERFTRKKSSGCNKTFQLLAFRC